MRSLILIFKSVIRSFHSQADLGSNTTVTGFIVQGRYEYDQWTTSVRFSYSSDDESWKFASEDECEAPEV